MFEVAKELLERIEVTFLPMPQLATNGVSMNFGCNPCSGTCRHSCKGGCKGSCLGGCDGSCKNHTR